MKKKNEQSLKNLWDNHKRYICVIRVSEGEVKESGAEKILEEIMPENFQNLAKDIAFTDSRK